MGARSKKTQALSGISAKNQGGPDQKFRPRRVRDGLKGKGPIARILAHSKSLSGLDQGSVRLFLRGALVKYLAFALWCMLALNAGAMAAPLEDPAPSPRRLNLFPELYLETLDERATPGGFAAVQGRLTPTRVWFSNPGLRCTSGLDSAALLWLTTRLVFVCPYAAGRTRLGVEIAPEIQWPTGESSGLAPRPGMRLAHVQNTWLGDRAMHVFRLSYKLAWQEKAGAEAPSSRQRSVSLAMVQDWSDLFDATVATGVLFRVGEDQQSSDEALLVEVEQTLPLSLRRWGVLEQSALARWTRLGVSYRNQQGAFGWGAGLHYGSLAFEWLQISALYPTLYLAWDLGGSP